MESVGHPTGPGRPTIPSPPRNLRVGILLVELILVVLIAYLVAQFTFRLLEVGPSIDGPLPSVEAPEADGLNTAGLTAFDPFFREIGTTEVPEQAVVRESSLRLEVFGLRASPNGQGSAIIKTQDGDQKVIQIGDRVASGVTLSAVYADRLEVNRGGVREAIYLRPQRERQIAPSQPRQRTASAQPVVSEGAAAGPAIDLTKFNLTPVRRERRIIGFQIPDPLPLQLLGSGIEAGDILTHANNEPLTSFERLEEIGEELSGNSQLTIALERRGEALTLTVNLGGNR